MIRLAIEKILKRSRLGSHHRAGRSGSAKHLSPRDELADESGTMPIRSGSDRTRAAGAFAGQSFSRPDWSSHAFADDNELIRKLRCPCRWCRHGHLIFGLGSGEPGQCCCAPGNAGSNTAADHNCGPTGRSGTAAIRGGLSRREEGAGQGGRCRWYAYVDRISDEAAHVVLGRVRARP